MLASVGYGVVDAVRRSTTPSGAILRDFTFCAETRIYEVDYTIILEDLIGRDLWTKTVIHLILIY